MKRTPLVWILFGCLLASPFALSAREGDEGGWSRIVEFGEEYSRARVEFGQRDGRPGLLVQFEGTDDLHYYASEASAPAPGLELKIEAQAAGLTFGGAEFPEVSYFTDPALDKEIEVYVGNFEVFVPITGGLEGSEPFTTSVMIKGIACTSQLCLPPFSKTLAVQVDPQTQQTQAVEAPAAEGRAEAPAEPAEAAQPLDTLLSGWETAVAGEPAEARPAPFYFLLALLAGLSINIMPCVLPVLPLIVMRLVSQAKESGPRRLTLGLAFCGGIILFFALFALISAVITLTTGAVIDINSLYRSPEAVIVLFLLIVFFALVFLDVLTLVLPSSVAGRQGGSGFAGSIGMGFFAGLLSTPCSGALLGAVLVWAQTQPLVVSSGAIVLMGVGMALPYAVLISIPRLMDFIPRPGAWMEIFKKTGGFLLLLIAVKFTLTALPKDRLINVLMYGVVFAFCVWMWGQWVSYSTPARRKWAVRLIAVVIAVGAGLWLLPAPPEPEVDWQPYDAGAIAEAIENDRPVLIKFTADWCTNCKVVERNVYQRPEIARLIERENFLPIKADTTQQDFAAAEALNTVFGEAGNVPVTVLLDPASQTLVKLRGIFTPDEFEAAVQSIE